MGLRGHSKPGARPLLSNRASPRVVKCCRVAQNGSLRGGPQDEASKSRFSGFLRVRWCRGHFVACCRVAQKHEGVPRRGSKKRSFPSSRRNRCVILEPITRMQGLLPAELSWLDFSVGSCRCILAMLCWRNFSVGSCRCPWEQGLLPAELCGLTLDPSGAHTRASSCGALSVLAVVSSQCSVAQLFRQILSLPHSRCSTTLGPPPGLLTAVAASALTRMQWLLPAELCWLDFSVGSCCCLLAVLCWLNFPVGSCRCPSEQMLCWPNFFVGSCRCPSRQMLDNSWPLAFSQQSLQCSAGATFPSDFVASPHSRCFTAIIA